MGSGGTTKRARRLLSVAISFVAIGALSACSLADSVATFLPGPEYASERQQRQFSDFYDQRINWTECGKEQGLDGPMRDALEDGGIDAEAIRCAMIAAPLDWADPANSESIELAVVHIPSTGDGELGTLLGNPGGPGATGIDFMLGMAISPGFEEVTANYDLLGFDPRGIGASTPIDCESAAESSELAAVQFGRCIADNPLTHTMGTVQVARDMDLLRALMRDDKLNYLGYSYGTMLGATYASLFPEQSGRLVLDSAENAAWASPIHLFEQQVAMSNAAIALATACTTEYQGEVSSCPFADEDSLMRVIDQLNEAPLVASDGNEVSGWMLREYLFGALYQSHFDRGRTLDTIALALFGDQEAIDEIADEMSGGGEDFAMKTVTCHSFPIEPDIPGLLEHIEERGMPRLLGGPEINDESLAQFVDLSCYVLPESGLDLTERFYAGSADPILVIGITGDHATPFPYASELTEELGNATLLTLDGQGHAASFTGRSTCVDKASTRYLLTGKLPAKGTVCTDDK
ncbi:alpha/beta hydrolase [Leucobacter sp. UT-8R-CII-1-4]|uniref:alpha/beta hydrolase n=1 Tax=Leucobacter sp. UT-8R-CII-1-4 TaxID=3040075 RepID=UPI0024A8BD96|nr:alpha/beta hydrolase [Leucobacter sp. UT-8R-CII-1-4]MDI6022870.1 alpha/beta hydrolase [Leucobacter sp. UT-8R-CII-1-4]